MYPFELLRNLPLQDSENTIRKILDEPLPDEEIAGVFRFLLSSVDLTSLEGSDTHDHVVQLCRTARNFASRDLPGPAAVCVYPVFVKLAVKELKDSGIRVACAAGGFPSGQLPLGIKLQEIRYAVAEGAHEIDVVLSRSTLLEGRYHVIYRELDMMRDAAAGTTMKVILETGELKSPENIAKACEIALEAGADFLKTSTGKIPAGATPEGVYVMLHTIRIRKQDEKWESNHRVVSEARKKLCHFTFWPGTSLGVSG